MNITLSKTSTANIICLLGIIIFICVGKHCMKVSNDPSYRKCITAIMITGIIGLIVITAIFSIIVLKPFTITWTP